MKSTRFSLGSLALTGLIAMALTAAPVGLDDGFSLEKETAIAKGKGSGNSGGKGGGTRGGRSSASKSGKSDGDRFGDDDDDNTGSGYLKAHGNGHLKHHADAEHDEDNDDHPNSHGKLASALGNLNAAHASPTALEHASENSIVGLLAAYAEAVSSGEGLTEDEARLALGEISNKSEFDEELGGDAVDAEVVAEVDRLLGLDEPEVADADDDEDKEL